MFKKRELGQEFAFGKIPAYCKYELYMERYRCAADFARHEFAGKDSLSILDIGSGRGRLKYFCDFNKQIEWHGIEVLDEMKDICTGLGYRMHTHDIEKAPLPFNDEKFDLVAGLHVLEHLADPRKALRDMGRVLKEGGLLVLGVPTKPPIIAEAINGWYRLRQARNPRPGRTCNAFSPSNFKRLLQNTICDALDIVDVRGFRLFSARRRLPLENMKWFYDISVWFGRYFPLLTPEINVILRKRCSQQTPAGNVLNAAPAE
ncbi:MAG: class I SAM-dependent methyltransferase [Verrucomicrobia bacterium]|nr:class I SAM-dependent methyltransferase [Verrucomicrobiota bacterium]